MRGDRKVINQSETFRAPSSGHLKPCVGGRGAWLSYLIEIFQMPHCPPRLLRK
jgi:hypothetical protein